jgi:CDP-glycerol glycerophosphotransferase (TagB/SpsB family)
VKGALLNAGWRELRRKTRAALAYTWIRAHPKEAADIRAERAWLLGCAAGKMYGDNSAALHHYLRRQHPQIPVYWVINRDSPDVSKAVANGPVLFSDKVSTYVWAMLAAVHVISHGVHDVPSCSSPYSSSAVKVRLGHGLTALKKTRPRPRHTNASANAVFDLVPVCSEFERGHKLEWGIEPEGLVVTGIPRFDTLLAAQRMYPTDRRRIVYMPTWRDNGNRSTHGKTTPYLRGIVEFLSNPALDQLLEHYDATLDVFFHMNIGEKAGAAILDERLGGPRVRRARLSDPQHLFAEAGLLITDYSSVAWDMLYLDKPVVFYQFDLDDYSRERGGYVSLKDDLPGPIAHSAEEAIGALASYLSGDRTAQEEHRQRMKRWQHKAFAFRDDRNCERVTAEIVRLLDARSSTPRVRFELRFRIGALMG